MQNQLTLLQNQIATSAQEIDPTPQSREYWASRIDTSIKYPGEDASKTAKRAYKQRVDSYLSKSAPVWNVVSGETECPITSDVPAMQTLKLKFGDLWEFKPKDIINRCLAVLKSENHDALTRIEAAMDDGDQSTKGSWRQRNAALYSVICDTLDLSKQGKDLDFLDVVDQNNGLAIYNLMKFRLAEIKSSDPLARAIKSKMGINHIKYTAQPLGVAKYFQEIEAHRSKLAALPRPKIIDDFEVIAKAIRELPPLHEQFQSAAYVLELQRKLSKSETTLTECRDAFVSADIDNDIVGDLGNKSKKKRPLRANLARTDKRQRFDKKSGERPEGRYEFGDCVHHPKSNTHRTCQCTNPFGLRSAFGLATSYQNKCAAIKTSVQAGWSPKATNVKIPQGYGCDGAQVSPAKISPAAAHAPQLKTYHAAVQRPSSNINPDELRVYNKVRDLMRADMQQMQQQPPPVGSPQVHQVANPQLAASPLRAYHTHMRHQPRYMGQVCYTQPDLYAQPAYLPAAGTTCSSCQYEPATLHGSQGAHARANSSKRGHSADDAYASPSAYG